MCPFALKLAWKSRDFFKAIDHCVESLNRDRHEIKIIPLKVALKFFVFNRSFVDISVFNQKFYRRVPTSFSNTLLLLLNTNCTYKFFREKDAMPILKLGLVSFEI